MYAHKHKTLDRVISGLNCLLKNHRTENNITRNIVQNISAHYLCGRENKERRHMKQNPCRHCDLAFVHNGRHSPSWNGKCKECQNIKEHRKYLKSQRKFIEGEPITTLDELLKQE